MKKRVSLYSFNTEKNDKIYNQSATNLENKIKDSSEATICVNASRYILATRRRNVTEFAFTCNDIYIYIGSGRVLFPVSISRRLVSDIYMESRPPRSSLSTRFRRSSFENNSRLETVAAASKQNRSVDYLPRDTYRFVRQWHGSRGRPGHPVYRRRYQFPRTRWARPAKVTSTELSFPALDFHGAFIIGN